MTRDDYLDKAQKLLHQAENAANDAEALTFRTKAFAFAARHDIDRAVLIASMSEDKRKQEEPIVEQILEFGRPYEQRLLLAYVAYHFYGNQAVKIIRRKGETTVRLRVFGFESDMRAGAMLHASLQLQCESACTVAQKNRGSERLSTFRRAYWQRWYIEIERRLNASKQRAVVESGTPGTAVAIRTRDEIVKADMLLRVGETKKTRASRARKGVAGDAAGYRDAQRADIGQSRIGDHGPKEIGA